MIKICYISKKTNAIANDYLDFIGRMDKKQDLSIQEYLLFREQALKEVSERFFISENISEDIESLKSSEKDTVSLRKTRGIKNVPQIQQITDDSETAAVVPVSEDTKNAEVAEEEESSINYLLQKMKSIEG